MFLWCEGLLVLVVDVHEHRGQQHQALDDLLVVDADAQDDMPLFITPMMKAPITAPITLPTPPEADAPPMKQAAITSSSKPRPALGVAVFRRAANMRPASAASTPMLMALPPRR